ncbi:MAG: hypothetical protein JSS27_21375 [Planctomycetes bacterium]|nr:hypothetical protein [Planctomycetota bacterium]
MTSKTFNIAVVVFWLTSMAWLVDQKILPTLIVGDPPSYRALLADKDKPPEPVGWRITLNDQPLGWAISRTLRDADGGQEFNTRLFAERVPLAAMTPAWINSFMRVLQQGGHIPDLRLDVDVSTRLSIDPLGRPFSLDSVAGLGYRSRNNTLAEGFRIRMDGKIDDNRLDLQIRSGDASYVTQFYLPRDSLVSDALSPQARLPNLRIGQSWSVPLYNPFRPPSTPVEMMRAAVERRDDLEWNGQSTPTLLIVYRSDVGSELSNKDLPRGRCWVAIDGNVIRQEMQMGTAQLAFERVAAPVPPHLITNQPIEPNELQPWWRTKE